MNTAIGVLIYLLQFGFGIGSWFAVWFLTEFATKRLALQKWSANAARTLLFLALAALALLLPDAGKSSAAVWLTGFAAWVMAVETVRSYRRQKATEYYERISRI